MSAIDEYLRIVVEQQASDLHLKAGSPPHIRVDGELSPLTNDLISPADLERLAFEIMPRDRAEEFARNNEADFAYSLSGLGRFRVNCFRQRGSVGLVARRVQAGIPGFEQLGLPPVVEHLANEPRGLILVTGPTGSGKTTSLAAMIDHINNTRRCHVVTIEDPIEVLHTDKMAIINQREVGVDTADFHQAMKRVLRQDPDVILVGEMRDPETVWAAMAAAETGHLVLATLHTTDATETVNRVIDFFPSHQQKQIRLSLAGSLRGIMSQRLIPRADGSGRVPAVEVLVMTGRIFDCIVDPEKTHEIHEMIKEGSYYGMQTFDDAMFQLYSTGQVTIRDALAGSSNPHDLKVKLQQAGLLPTSGLVVEGVGVV
ncbi:MAG: PilT/PilU family type 4a pilus ATPase [Actinobacteria bacterium ATB1]|nr:PilT/PilU family type 4a pilus ATPase [Actinobacteria bacterium ATB1]